MSILDFELLGKNMKPALTSFLLLMLAMVGGMLGHHFLTSGNKRPFLPTSFIPPRQKVAFGER